MWYGWYFNFSHSSRYLELFHWVLICMYLVPIEVELHFLSLLVIWFPEVPVKISCLLLLNVFFLLIHEFLIFLDMNSVLLNLLQVYSPILWLDFSLIYIFWYIFKFIIVFLIVDTFGVFLSTMRSWVYSLLYWCFIALAF